MKTLGFGQVLQMLTWGWICGVSACTKLKLTKMKLTSLNFMVGMYDLIKKEVKGGHCSTCLFKCLLLVDMFLGDSFFTS